MGFSHPFSLPEDEVDIYEILNEKQSHCRDACVANSQSAEGRVHKRLRFR